MGGSGWRRDRHADQAHVAAFHVLVMRHRIEDLDDAVLRSVEVDDDANRDYGALDEDLMRGFKLFGVRRFEDFKRRVDRFRADFHQPLAGIGIALILLWDLKDSHGVRQVWEMRRETVRSKMCPFMLVMVQVIVCVSPGGFHAGLARSASSTLNQTVTILSSLVTP